MTFGNELERFIWDHEIVIDIILGYIACWNYLSDIILGYMLLKPSNSISNIVITSGDHFLYMKI